MLSAQKRSWSFVLRLSLRLGLASGLASGVLLHHFAVAQAAPPLPPKATPKPVGLAKPTPLPAAKPPAGKPAKPAGSAKSDPKKDPKKEPKKPEVREEEPGTGPVGFKPLITPTGAAKYVAGGATAADTALGAGAESAELRLVREAEFEMFAPGAAPAGANPFPVDVPSAPKGPLVSTGGLPPMPIAPAAPELDRKSSSGSPAWLSSLKMPDFPIRWEEKVVKYLEFFRDDPRGKRAVAYWWKRMGRYRALIAEQLHAKSLPEDLVWIAMAESGFDPAIRSPAGAIGLWQFMPETARLYGLSVDRWADLRHSPLRATEAAAMLLGDLKKRFGTWELAMAAYNMGYGGVLATIKRYNSNDYWELSRFENGLPWETTNYVPKIMAMAIVGRNPDVFGLAGIVQDTALKGDRVDVAAGTELRAIAGVAGCTVKELELLNPELRAGRTPPASDEGATYTILVPTGRGPSVRDAAGKLSPKTGALERYVVRFGESVDQIAAARKTSKARIMELNGISKDEAVRAGTTLLVPTLPTGTVAPAGPYVGAPLKATAVVPASIFVYPDRTRVFYRVVVGDGLREIAEAFSIRVDELRAWNAIELTARLQEGMLLQVYVPKGTDLSRVRLLRDSEVKVVSVGSDEFHALEEAAKGKKRVTVFAKGGETLEQIGKPLGLSPAQMEKINRRPRGDVLKKGEPVIAYVPEERAKTLVVATATPPKSEPAKPDVMKPDAAKSDLTSLEPKPDLPAEREEAAPMD